MSDYIYDIETYPNVFTLALREMNTENRWIFELSDWRDDTDEIMKFVDFLRVSSARMIGFNNIGFDYPVLHKLLEHYSEGITAFDLYEKAQAIITADDNARFAHMVWESDHWVPQIDLFKVHHFDNRAKSTSLKVLEFNMRSFNIKDLPYEPGRMLTQDEVKVLRHYNMHDVDETHKFTLLSWTLIEFREGLSEKYGRNMLNFNDTKIGKEYFISELEKAQPGCCWDRSSGRKKARQTHRSTMNLGQLILPSVTFEHDELKRVLTHLKLTSISSTNKDALGKLTATVDDFEFVFGVGGIHGSIDSTIVESDEENVIIDLDVTSYYPSLAIQNRFFPEHIGPLFCDVYGQLFEMRKQYAKKTLENEMLKLALNGTFGDTNNVYSPLFDPQCLISITLNGQLLLVMLAEQLMKTPGLKMIQANTDGVTVRFPRSQTGHVKAVCKWWETLTQMNLEEVEYSRMFIRDVNNYIAEDIDGKLKRKGAYEYILQTGDGKGSMGWNQDHSALVVQMAAEAALVRGEDIRTFIEAHDDAFDFMLRIKVPRSSRLVIVRDGVDHPSQNVTRYYIANVGGALVKIMPELPSKPGSGERRIGKDVKWLVRECNDIKDGNPWDVNFDYYVQEAEKLVNKLKGTI